MEEMDTPDDSKILDEKRQNGSKWEIEENTFPKQDSQETAKLLHKPKPEVPKELAKSSSRRAVIPEAAPGGDFKIDYVAAGDKYLFFALSDGRIIILSRNNTKEGQFSLH